jgi:hypothetical protein
MEGDLFVRFESSSQARRYEVVNINRPGAARGCISSHRFVSSACCDFDQSQLPKHAPAVTIAVARVPRHLDLRMVRQELSQFEEFVQ